MVPDYGYDPLDGSFQAPQSLILDGGTNEVLIAESLFLDFGELAGPGRDGTLNVGETLDFVNPPMGAVSLTYQGFVTLGGLDMPVLNNGAVDIVIVPPSVDGTAFIGQMPSLTAGSLSFPAATPPSPTETVAKIAAYDKTTGNFVGDGFTPGLPLFTGPITLSTPDGTLSVGDIALVNTDDRSATAYYQGSTTINGEIGLVFQLPGVTGEDDNFVLFLNDPGDLSGTTLIQPLDGTDVPLCFAEGTVISTPSGEVCVEELNIGDLVLTAAGAAVPVKWIGRQRLHKLSSGPHIQPVRIRSGALGDGLPVSDLTVTSDHGLVIDGLVINASALVNGTTIDWVPMDELEDRFTVYHVETENHDVILANGAPSETFVDCVTRRNFDNYQEYLDLYGAERVIPEMTRPRVSARRLVPEAIRARLAGANSVFRAGQTA